MPSFEGLYNEVLAVVFGFCDSQDVLQLSLASKRLRDVTLPLIFREIDISIHDLETLPHEVLGQGLLDFDRTIIPRWIERRQCLFIKAIRTNPSLGKLVKKLKWTLIWPDEPSQPSFTDGEYLNVWKVFAFLEEVRKLDLAAFHCNTQSYVRDSPTKLFPKAASIRIGGIMHKELAVVVLGSSAAENVEALSFYYLQDEGVDFAGDPITLAKSFSMFNDFYRRFRRHPIDGDCLDGAIWTCPGPIRNVLPQFHFRNLRHLHIAKPGRILTLGGLGWSEQFFPNMLDEVVYKEYAAFLDAVRLTLETFTFEQNGIERFRKRKTLPNEYCEYHMISLMDTLFRSHIFPVLAAGEWPRLKRVRILGFGRADDHPPLLSSKQMLKLEQNLRDVDISFCTDIAGGFDYFEGYMEHSRWQARKAIE